MPALPPFTNHSSQLLYFQINKLSLINNLLKNGDVAAEEDEGNCSIVEDFKFNCEHEYCQHCISTFVDFLVANLYLFLQNSLFILTSLAIDSKPLEHFDDYFG